MTDTHDTDRPTAVAARKDALPAAVLFDMDGLLIDTEPLWFEVETQLLEEHGGSWSHDDHARLVGSALAVASSYLSERIGGRLAATDVAAELVARMAVRLRTAPAVQPGVRELIAELDAAGIPRALVSSSFRVLVDAVLDAIAPLSFGVVVAGDAVENNKPHPEPYLTAARALGVAPADCVALEDSPNGATSAGAAGCRVIAVPSVAPIEPTPTRVVLASLDGVGVTFLRSLFDR